MKKFILIASFFTLINAEFKLPQVFKDIGKQTPIDITLYAKNPSTKCTLTIKNISFPNDNNKTKIPTILLKPGHYFQKEYKNILKGSYEFEYTFSKDKKFIDSSLKTKHILLIHNNKLKVHKKFNPTLFLKVPIVCR
jgi:hypothetical protein